MVSRMHRAFGAVVLSVFLLLVVFVGSGIVPLGAPDRAVGPGPISAETTDNFDQLVVVLMENHDLPDIYGRATYMTQLVDEYGLAQHWQSLVNPSQVNYIGLIGGSTFGLSGDGNHPNLNYPTIVDILENTGKTWKAFAEDASGTGCGLDPPRGEDHFPFLSFTTITGNSARCANLLPGSGNEVISAFNAGTNFIWLTPNDCNNMHSCSVATGDNWIQSWVPTLLTAMSGKKAALLILYDEAYRDPPYIFAGFIGPAAKLAYKSTVDYNHYSFLKLVEDVWGGGDLGQNDVNATSPVEFFLPGGPDFSLAANPSSVAFGTGQAATSTISLASTGGFTGTIDITAASTPLGVTTSCVPSSLSGNQTSACTLTADTPGSYAVTITGTNGTLVHTATVRATVSPPDFSLTANPNSVSFVVNESATSSIRLQSTGGFSGTVELNATSSPSGVTTSCSRMTLVGSQSSTCTLNATTAGSYTVTITGTSGSLTHATSIGISVTPVPQPDFSLVANPEAVSFAAGDSVAPTISIVATGGFSDTVHLAAASNPAGVTTDCSPVDIQGLATATCTMSGSSAGLFTVVVTGTSGSFTRTTSISVTVSPGEPKPDIIPPQITISSPSNASVLPFATVMVMGNASDNVAIQTVELSTDNVTWIPTNGTATWSGNVTVGAGTTAIYARATDTAGNRHTVRIHVVVESVGGIPPPPPADGSPLSVDPPIPLHLVVVLAGAAAALEAILALWVNYVRSPTILPQAPKGPPPPRSSPGPFDSLQRLTR